MNKKLFVEKTITFKRIECTISIVSTPVVYYTLLINILLLYIKRPSKLLMDKKRMETMEIISMNSFDNYSVESKKTIAKPKKTNISIEIS